MVVVAVAVAATIGVRGACKGGDEFVLESREQLEQTPTCVGLRVRDALGPVEVEARGWRLLSMHAGPMVSTGAYWASSRKEVGGAGER
jgi:hypothetical protein